MQTLSVFEHNSESAIRPTRMLIELHQGSSWSQKIKQMQTN